DAGMRSNSVYTDRVVSSAFAGADERTVLACRLHDEGSLLPFRMCLNHRAARDRTDFFVACEENFDIFEARPAAVLNGLHGIQERDETCLHVDDSRPVCTAIPH